MTDDIPDVLVIGAGASGAALSWRLGTRGFRVVCLEQGSWVAPSRLPAYQPDWEIHRSTDFHPDPNVRQRPEDYPVENGESPIAPLMFNALGATVGHRVPWGSNHHRVLAERLDHTITLGVTCEDLPEEPNDVTLDPVLTDNHGIPAPRIRYRVSENSQKILDHGIARSTEVLAAAGATTTLVNPMLRTAGWHLLGTARMGDDPARSVVDRWCRLHDVPNLYIIDGSVFVTSAGVNPTPTIQALALRTADHLADGH